MEMDFWEMALLYDLINDDDDDYSDSDSSIDSNRSDHQEYIHWYRHRRRQCHACISRIKRVDSTPQVTCTTISIREGFSLGNVLELQPYLLEYIFEYLDFPSLKSVKSVNGTWKQLAVRELNRRNTCSWISCVSTPGLYDVQTSRNYFYNKPVFALLAYCPNYIKLEKIVCADWQRMTFGEYLDREAVPYDMQICVIGCPKVPPANIANKNASILYQGIFIPSIPRAQIKKVHYNMKTNPSILYNIIREEVKCVLVFSRKYQPRKTRSLLSLLLDGRPSHYMAVGGGLVKNSKLRPSYDLFTNPDDLLCIVFVQKKSKLQYFNTYSIVVPEEDTSDEAGHYKMFENALLKLKQTAVMYQSGVIFHFCCFEKRFKKEEYALVKKHFPKYSAFNVEVDGGIGWNSMRCTESVVEPTKPKRKKLKPSLPNILHKRSSVLVLVTWTKI